MKINNMLVNITSVMKKAFFFAALAVVALGACTKSEVLYDVTEADAVNFGAYSGRNVTKAGPTDDMNV